jgi:hypothetical protein
MAPKQRISASSGGGVDALGFGGGTATDCLSNGRWSPSGSGSGSKRAELQPESSIAEGKNSSLIGHLISICDDDCRYLIRVMMLRIITAAASRCYRQFAPTALVHPAASNAPLPRVCVPIAIYHWRLRCNEHVRVDHQPSHCHEPQRTHDEVVPRFCACSFSGDHTCAGRKHPVSTAGTVLFRQPG